MLVLDTLLLIVLVPVLTRRLTGLPTVVYLELSISFREKDLCGEPNPPVDLCLPVEAQEIIHKGLTVHQALQGAVHEAGVAQVLEAWRRRRVQYHPAVSTFFHVNDAINTTVARPSVSRWTSKSIVL